jgi:tetratricopeptide (TPR) repeat protein
MTSPLQRARELDAQGQHGPALMAYRLALRQDPGCRPAKVELAGLLLVLGRAAEARDLCLEVLAEGELPAARLNLAGALHGLDRAPEAEAEYRRLLTAEPVLARLGLATSLEAQDRLAEARTLLEQLLEREPGQAQGRELLLRVLLQLKDWPAVRTLWLAIADALPPFECTLERAVVHLLFGEFEPGWALMEHRLDRPGFIEPVRNYTEPRWDGAPFPGRTLLLHWEQGFGDTLMLLRYAPLAKARGGRVLALVPEALRTLAATVPGIDGVLGPDDPLPAFDLQLSIFSLPWRFGTRLDTVPAAIPYLAAPPGPVPGLDPGYRVGLVWAGNRDNRNDSLRSIPLTQLAPLAGVPVAWHSFQVGEAGGLPWPGIRDLAPELPDFAATARALEAMDLVITVDTGVAHLAGALGRPTWLLLPFLPEWRWLLGREDSPWYPTLRIFRQERASHWPGVLARVAAALLERVRGTC